MEKAVRRWQVVSAIFAVALCVVLAKTRCDSKDKPPNEGDTPRPLPAEGPFVSVPYVAAEISTPMSRADRLDRLITELERAGSGGDQKRLAALRVSRIGLGCRHLDAPAKLECFRRTLAGIENLLARSDLTHDERASLSADLEDIKRRLEGGER